MTASAPRVDRPDPLPPCCRATYERAVEITAALREKLAEVQEEIYVERAARRRREAPRIDDADERARLEARLAALTAEIAEERAAQRHREGPGFGDAGDGRRVS